MKKWILGVFLSFVMVLETHAEIIASGNDCAADDEESSCHWELDSSGKLNITGSGVMKEWTENDWYDHVDHGQPWFQYADFVNEVDVQGLSSISLQAFDGFSKINKVTMSDSVESIGRYAFRDSPITSLDLSENVTSIERYAFQGHQLTTLEIPASLNTLIDGVFYSETLQTVIVPSDIISMGYDMFGRDVEKLKNTNIVCKGGNCDTLKEMFQEYMFWNGENWETTSILSDNFIITDEREDGKIIAYDADGHEIGEYDSFDAMLTAFATPAEPEPVMTPEPIVETPTTEAINSNFTAERGKRIYTVKEANEAAGKKNKVMIRYK